MSASKQSRSSATSGRGLGGVIRRHPLGSFFTLAFAFSWSYWIPAAIAGGRLSHFPGLLGPMIAALVVTRVVEGAAGLRGLLGRMAKWRIPARWYAAALIPAASGLAAVGASSLFGRDLPTLEALSRMPELPDLGWFGVLALVLLVNGFGEEVGWRGFAWPRLRQRHTMGGAAVLLAALWAAWHLPAFWMDTGLRGFDLLVIPGWLVGLAAGAVVLGWLYERSGSSLLIVPCSTLPSTWPAARPGPRASPRPRRPSSS